MFEKATQHGIKTRHGTIHNKEWRMLIMDGHGSHLTMEFMDYCWNTQIVPFKLIAYSTHLLQPCDVGFCVYNCIIIHTPFPYPKLCPYPKPPQQRTPIGTLITLTNQIAAHELRAPIRPQPAGQHANTKPKRE